MLKNITMQQFLVKNTLFVKNILKYMSKNKPTGITGVHIVRSVKKHM